MICYLALGISGQVIPPHHMPVGETDGRKPLRPPQHVRLHGDDGDERRAEIGAPQAAPVHHIALDLSRAGQIRRTLDGRYLLRLGRHEILYLRFVPLATLNICVSTHKSHHSSPSSRDDLNIGQYNFQGIDCGSLSAFQACSTLTCSAFPWWVPISAASTATRRRPSASAGWP